MTTDPVTSVVSLGRRLRLAGVPATPDRVHAFASAVACLDPMRGDDVYWAGRLTLCADPDDIARYDAVFSAWLRGATGLRGPRIPQTITIVKQAVTARMDGERDSGTDSDADDQQHGLAATELDILRQRDVAKLSAAQRAEIRRHLALLDPVGPPRVSRRHRPARRGPLDSHRTVRAMLARGGEPARLRRHQRGVRPRRLVFLIDVSGSMAAYADALLRFAHAAVRRRRATEVFTMGTRLTRISRELRHRDPDMALAAAGDAVPDWSGGTRLGEQLKAFCDRWGQRGAARGALVVVGSDGWERGDAALLGEQMARLHRLAHRVVWVNPHVGVPGFAPATAGMAAALPYIDDLVAGHSLAAYEELAALLSARAGATMRPLGGVDHA